MVDDLVLDRNLNVCGTAVVKKRKNNSQRLCAVVFFLLIFSPQKCIF